MNSLQIKLLLKSDSKTKSVFKKVCALDQLEKPTFPSAYDINSDPSTEPGEHWITVYFDKHRRGEYFDSYGLPPAFVGLKSYMDTYSLSDWIYNRKTLQALFSSVCGHFACTLYYFVVAAYLCALLYPILHQTFLKTIVVFLILFAIYYKVVQ